MAIPLTPTPQSRDRFPLLLALLIVIASILVGVVALLSLRPEVVAPTGLLDKFLPAGSAIRQVREIDLNVEGVTSRPIFQTLKEHAALPIQIPATGKSNPFL